MRWKYLTESLTAITDRGMEIKTIILGFCFSIVSSIASGQVDSLRMEEIAVMARPSTDSIVLRWAPLSYRVWRSGNKYGYRIERFLIVKSDKLISPPLKTVLTNETRPWPEPEWEQLVTTNQYAAIAAQALFGERFEVDLQESDIISIVDKVKENEQRYAFALFSADMSPQVATASGLWFTDRTIKAEEKYLYRIVVNGPHGYYGSTYVGAEDEYSLPKPQNLKGEFSDLAVSLRWDRLTTTPYTAFILERSVDGKTFSKVSDRPIVTLSPENRENLRYEYAIDSLPNNATTYYYRVKGVTPFGEEGPGSDPVSGKGIADVERVPYITSAQSADNRTISLEWDFPETSNAAISGFRIERSSTANDKYIYLTRELISPLNREYVDTSPQAVNYYRVQAQGLDGQLYISHAYFAQLVDSIPPHIPDGLQAAVDEEGKVSLSWTPNRDADIYGYRVYRSWLRSEESSQITDAPIRAHQFMDHLNLYTLNDSVYYRLMAVDINQNHSILSEFLAVSLPDKVKPQAPVILPDLIDTTGAALSWTAGASEDIVAYAIYRKSASDPGWLPVATIRSGTDSVYTYVDNQCPSAKQVYYTVLAIDDSGLESDPAQPVGRTCFLVSLPDAVKWKKPKIMRDENQIRLFWAYESSELNSFKIFRSVNHAPPVLLKTLAGAGKEYTDTIIPGNIYSYRIMACFLDGKKSALSDELEFAF